MQELLIDRLDRLYWRIYSSGMLLLFGVLFGIVLSQQIIKKSSATVILFQKREREEKDE